MIYLSLIPTFCNVFRILYQEVDYINEAKNADRFRRDFRNIKWVRVPVCFLLKTTTHTIYSSVKYAQNFYSNKLHFGFLIAGVLGLYCDKGVNIGICSRFPSEPYTCLVV